MRNEPARLGEISLRWEENFPYEHMQMGQPGKMG